MKLCVDLFFLFQSVHLLWESEIKEQIPQGIHHSEQARHDSVERNGNKNNFCIWIP